MQRNLMLRHNKLRYFILLFYIALNAHNVTDYKVVHYCGKYNKKYITVIRDFKFDKNDTLLVVDNDTLKSYLIPKDKLKQTICSPTSHYKELLELSHTPPYPLQNDGITNIGNSIHITTDLCPSSKRGYEKRLYIALPKYLKPPVAITIFVTGRWIKRHQKEFNELLKMDRDGNLSISWGNHTYKHIYHPHKSLRDNFVLSAEEKFIPDILDLEKLLISKGVTPSIYFRFPGLISNQKDIDIVANLGLITIGSDSWLAKGQKIKKGSIILVHGNRNEPKGVDILLRLLKRGLEFNATRIW